MFIIGYFASMFNSLSNDLHEHYLPLAIVMVLVFSALVGIGIFRQARSNVVANVRIEDLEKRIQNLERKLQDKN